MGGNAKPVDRQLVSLVKELDAKGKDQEFSPPKWTVELSAELQEAVDSFCIEELRELGFSVTIADPAQPDCPLVACSAGFTTMTGYSVQETVGRNCRFLMQGVPDEYIDNDTRSQCRLFCDGMEQQNKGEVLCAQTNARK